MLKNLLRAFVLLVLLIAQVDVNANELAQNGKIERIGGDFLVKSIHRKSDGSFAIVFESESPQAKFKTLNLESAHVHVAIVEKSKIRLSADVIDIDGTSANVSQVVLFLPGREGRTPIWMLSKSARPKGPPSKLIEMHVPSTDYQLM